jgi:hypothetical protein
MSDHEIVNRLRRISEYSMFDETINETADLLEFLLDRFQPATLELNDQHRWKFYAGWPWKHARGATIEAALQAALAEQKRGMGEIAARKART